MCRKVAYLLIVGCLLCAQALGAPDGLMGYWSFDEGVGNTAFDGSGNGNDGVLNGGPAWVEGVLGTALDFAGTNSFVAAPHIPLNSRTFTIALWVNASSLPGDQIVFSQVQSGALNTSMHFRIMPTGVVRMGFYSNDLDTPAGMVEIGKWTHLAFVYDFETGDRRVYVNGVREADQSGAAPYLGTTGDTVIGSWNGGEWFNGMIDDVQIYHNALTDAEVLSIMNGLGNPNLASAPNPADEAQDVIRDSVLTWAPGENAGTRNIYVGDSVEDVNSMTTPTAANLTVTSFDPGRLEFSKTYFWRVDEINSTPDKTVFKGDIWSFTAEPYAIQVPVDVNNVTASSAAQLNPPALIVNGAGLSGMTHGAASETMWLSGAADFSPWLMFEFDRVEKLDQMLIWNSNSTSEGFIGWGLKGVSIEYSIDGTEWTALAEPTQLDRAPGLPTYDTPQAVDFGLVEAKFVRINIQSNWGGLLPQYGVAEVQFYALPVHAREPKPASGSTNIRPDAVVTWRSGREAGQHTVYVSDDVNAVADASAPSVTSMTNSADLKPLDLQMSQTYYWRVDEVNDAETPSAWTGPMWSFDASTALVVENFESYGNLSPDRPFQHWLDGYGYSADEFYPVEYAGNGTGAGIGHDIWGPSSPYFGGSLMETGSTIPGSTQSLPFYYNNTGGAASETQHTFAVPQDWTVGGATLVSVPFRGMIGNTGSLYVKINNVKVTYPRDASNLTIGGWMAFNIDLSTVNTNLQSVTKIAIGVDGSGASGMILIDDITLHKAAGQVVTPTDPGTNGLFAQYSFEGNANDVSGNGHNGTLVGSAGFTAGAKGQALNLDGIDGCVDLGPAGGFNFAGSFSVCAWVNITELTAGWGHAIMGNRGEDNLGWQLRRHSSTPNLTFTVRGTTGADDPQGTVNVAAMTGEWIQVTGVYDMEAGLRTLYVNGMLDVQIADTGVCTPSTHNVYIGARAVAANTGPEAFFYGLIDDVRVYNRALSAGEALSLAGGTSDIDVPF
ncbi:MAG: discoidin domain-containing protein [Phycisphaerae bacterium]|nr:discoidin domain-containing protein [Phycisphaerae bacterium]